MIWFSADHHFGHFNVIRYCSRPYTSVYEMNEDMIQKWNAVVSPTDEVWYLGDFSMSAHYLPILKKLNGSIKLIVGNHDKAFPKKKIKPQAVQLYRDVGFVEVHLEPVKFEEFWLCHFPYAGDHPNEERFAAHRVKDDNYTWVLHGHVHNSLPRLRPRQLNVGVDCWDFRPVNINQIRTEIEKLK